MRAIHPQKIDITSDCEETKSRNNNFKEMYMRHSSPSRPSRDPHFFLFFPHICNMLKGFPKKYRTRSFRFFEKNFGVNITQNNSKN